MASSMRPQKTPGSSLAAQRVASHKRDPERVRSLAAIRQVVPVGNKLCVLEGSSLAAQRIASHNRDPERVRSLPAIRQVVPVGNKLLCREEQHMDKECLRRLKERKPRVDAQPPKVLSMAHLKTNCTRDETAACRFDEIERDNRHLPRKMSHVARESGIGSHHSRHPNSIPVDITMLPNSAFSFPEGPARMSEIIRIDGVNMKLLRRSSDTHRQRALSPPGSPLGGDHLAGRLLSPRGSDLLNDENESDASSDMSNAVSEKSACSFSSSESESEALFNISRRRERKHRKKDMPRCKNPLIHEDLASSRVTITGNQIPSIDRPVVPPTHWGMTHRQIDRFFRWCKTKDGWTSSMDVRTMVEVILKPNFVRMSVALTYNIMDPKRINVLISHSWDENVERFFEDVLSIPRVADDVFFICFLSVFQGHNHEIDVQVTQGSTNMANGCFAAILEDVASQNGRMYVVTNEELAQNGQGLYSRLWCTWEIVNCVRFGIPITFPPKILRESRNSEHHLFGNKGIERFSACDGHCGPPDKWGNKDEKGIKSAVEHLLGTWGKIDGALKALYRCGFSYMASPDAALSISPADWPPEEEEPQPG